MGVRGVLLVALLAAAMSSFNAFLNLATSFWTRDLYQGFFRPQAGNRELLRASYGFGIALVILALVMAYSTESINDIWGWLMMGLVGGMVVPTVLRLYWWRFNGGGYAIGTLIGLVAAILQRLLLPHLPEWQQFAYILTIGLVASIIGTFITKPTDSQVLERFYRTTRPFGWWGPLRRGLPAEMHQAMAREHRNDLLALPFACGWQITLFLLPMQAMIRSWTAFGVTLAIFLSCLAGLYVFWYRNLPATQPAAPASPMATSVGAR
jgi:SSS family solute:Na+ symporter